MKVDLKRVGAFATMSADGTPEEMAQFCKLCGFDTDGLHFMRGPAGPMGPQGEPGPIGPQGPMGMSHGSTQMRHTPEFHIAARDAARDVA